MMFSKNTVIYTVGPKSGKPSQLTINFKDIVVVAFSEYSRNKITAYIQ